MFRRVRENDAKACLRIYRPYVEKTAISFEEDVPSVKIMRQRIQHSSRQYPWLIYEQDSKVAGYAYASGFRPRPAYRWSAEVTIYITEKIKGTGIAQCLYQKLFEILIKQGFHNAIAVITEPNPESEKFHQKMGFRRIGVFQSVGYKLNRWHNIGWWQKQLQTTEQQPIELIPFSAIELE